MLYRQDYKKHAYHGMRVDCAASARKRGMTIDEYEAMIGELFESLPASLNEDLIKHAIQEAKNVPRGEV